MARTYADNLSDFQRLLETKQYPGSSKVWGDLGDRDWLQGRSRPGLGYAGDRAKNEIAARYGLTPQSIGTSPDSWATQDTSGTTMNDVAVLGQDGRWYSSTTGKIFTGTDGNTGKVYNNGYEQQNVDDRYKAVSVVKDPGVASAADDLLTTFKKEAATALPSFDQHLSDFNADLSAARDKSKTATDVTGFESSLRTGQTRYNTSLDAAGTDYEALNRDNEAKQRALEQRAYDILPQYDEAAGKIGDRQLAALVANNSRYKMGSGTPRSLSSNDQNILARNVADVYLPLEQQRIARNLDLVTNLSLPVQRELYGNERTRLTQFNPEIARQEFASGQATEQTIQGVRQQVASMSFDDATRFMQAIGVPDQVRQQILSSQINQLGQIGQLREGAEYRGLMDQQGAYPSQVQSYNMNVPGYPAASAPSLPSYPSSTYPSSGNSLNAGNAPVTVGPNNQVVGDPNGPRDLTTPQGRANYYAYLQRSAGLNTSDGRYNVYGNEGQANSIYQDGVLVDRYTGART